MPWGFSWKLAGWRTKPNNKPHGMASRVSVVIPVYNEKETLAHLLDSVKKCPVSLHEIIIVDDASTDGTAELMRELFQHDDRVKLLFHPKNQGKGGALHTGFSHVAGDIVIIQDADLEYDPADYPKLLNPILKRGADVVFGSRFTGSEEHRVLYFWHTVANRLLTLLSNMFSDLNLTDMETCYKAFKTDVLKKIKLREKRFGFEPEFTAKVAKARCKIFEVGISYNGRTYEEGKKIGLKDAFRALYCILRYNCFE